jgi:hypothetical protein
MHGRRSLVLAALLLAFAGCTDEPSAETPPAPIHPDVGAAFDRDDTGTIGGLVVWQGPAPQVPDLLVLPDSENPDPEGKRLYWTPNPFRPLIGFCNGGGMRDVVVHLRTVDPQRTGPWQRGRVRIEQEKRKLSVLQDGTHSRVGFVRRGDEIEAVNRDDEYHSLRLRGAACSALPFVEKDRISTKRLDTAGIVELTSGAGYFWMCAHLFVCEHPYYARTNASGQFRLTKVPPGHYELVCWMPSWVVRRKVRDPESALTSRIVFAPPLEQSRTIEVRTGSTVSACFQWDAPR